MTDLVPENDEQKPVGYIVGGGLRESLRVRLTIPAQEVQEGAFLVTETKDWLFYGLRTERRPPPSPTLPTAARPDSVHQPGNATHVDAAARPRTGHG